jgi:Rod binding domain-containing protein
MVADVRAADGGSGHADRIALRRAAEEFEAAFLGQLLGGMTQGLAGDGPLGGGNDPFAAMLRDEYGRLIARGGGIGVADAVMRQLLRLQERS